MDMEFQVKDNVIYELKYDGVNIIEPWGIETADTNSFFSLQDWFGYRYSVLNSEKRVSDMEYYQRQTVKMKDGLWKIETCDQFTGNHTMERMAKIECLEDSVFMDFVIRFRFKKELFQYAKIADKIITFNGTDKYYQFPVDEAFLVNDSYVVRISILDSETAKNAFTPVIYVRDSNYDGWVVHVRLIPKRNDFEVIKLCNALCGTRALPNVLSRRILQLPEWRKKLLYAGEKKVHLGKIMRKINPNAFIMVRLHKGEVLKLQAKFEIVSTIHFEDLRGK